MTSVNDDAQSVRTSASGRMVRRNRAEGGGLDGMRLNVQVEFLEEINKRLDGQLDLQVLVLGQFTNGTLAVKNRSNSSDHELPVAQSTNKFSFLSIDNWASILIGVDPIKFDKHILT